MENIEFWIYAAFGIVYFIVTMMKKRKNASDPRQSPPPNPDGEPAASFEELLQEITSRKQAYDTEETIGQDTTLDNDHAQRETYADNRAFSDEESRKIYEDAVRSVQSVQSASIAEEQAPSLTDSRPAEKKNDTKGSIHALLSSPGGAKKAIILSEILNRKYRS